MERRRLLTEGRAAAALESLGLLPLSRHGHTPLLARVWELRENIKSYDAAYVALAEALDCPLLTKDVALSRVKSVRCAVEVLG
jgi:predicted nucleic acid-binding protein